jgi:hypothetical protein
MLPRKSSEVQKSGFICGFIRGLSVPAPPMVALRDHQCRRMVRLSYWSRASLVMAFHLVNQLINSPHFSVLFFELLDRFTVFNCSRYTIPGVDYTLRKEIFSYVSSGRSRSNIQRMDPRPVSSFPPVQIRIG